MPEYFFLELFHWWFIASSYMIKSINMLLTFKSPLAFLWKGTVSKSRYFANLPLTLCTFSTFVKTQRSLAAHGSNIGVRFISWERRDWAISWNANRSKWLIWHLFDTPVHRSSWFYCLHFSSGSKSRWCLWPTLPTSSRWSSKPLRTFISIN